MCLVFSTSVACNMPKGFLLQRPSCLAMSAPNPKKRLLHCALIDFAEVVSHEMPLPPSPVSPGSGSDSPVNLTTSVPPSLPVSVEAPLTPDYFQDMPAAPKFAMSVSSAALTGGTQAGRLSPTHVSIVTSNAQPYTVLSKEETGPPVSLPTSKRLCTSKFTCKLCRLNFSDALSLARHVCAAIRPVEYRCPECDKVFNNPANLASHRRWHKPSATQQLQCPHCAQFFRRNSLLKKHIETEHPAHRQRQQPHQHQSRPQATTQDKEDQQPTHESRSQPMQQSQPFTLSQSSQDHNSLTGEDQTAHLGSLHAHPNFVIHGLIHHPESPFMPPRLPGIH